MRSLNAVCLVRRLALVSSTGLIFAACSADNGATVGGGGQSGPPNPNPGGGGAGGSGLTLPTAGSGGPTGGQGGDSTQPALTWPLPNFINNTAVSIGDYAVSKDELSAMTQPPAGDGGNCTGILFGVVRDFKMGTLEGGHRDFEVPPTGMGEKGIVKDTLGDDGKPVYAHDDQGTTTTSGPAHFGQWYWDTDGVNKTYVVALRFVAGAGGVVTFAASRGNTGLANPNSSYFPLDGQGWNDTARADDRQMHNFAFTTEIHTTFKYNGGETFKFQGDDDVFVFINKHLAIDLGGIHDQQTATVDLDAQAEAFGIAKGNSYDLAVFNAERHTTRSNFRIDTTMTFENCGIIPIIK
jgi:fibro-slime domain-containing protein